MAQLRSVDPRTLRPNPDNPRRTPAPPAMEEQLVASVRAIGIIQPPVVIEKDGDLVIKVGDRRVKAAIRAELASIDVLVAEADEARDMMGAVSENVVRAALSSVDLWRGIDALERQGWNDAAIADAMALPLRTVRRLKLLAHLHPPMLEVMAEGSMPSEEQLRTIAAATVAEQAQVWKKFKPKKGQDCAWYEVSRALSRRRIPFASARFDADLAKAHGVVWREDLFAPAGEDGRYTTDVDGFFGAQQEWLANNLPERGTLLLTDEYGRYQLPKKAEHVYGKPGRKDLIGHYLDPHSGEVRTVVYRLPEPKTAKDAASEPGNTRPRPDVMRKGQVMIGDLRTDALHQALREAPIADSTLLGMLVLALAGRNITVHSGGEMGGWERDAIARAVIEGGGLTADLDRLRAAARGMLVASLSCRENISNSGIVARIAGEAAGAAAFLPSMATDEFLSCLSRQELERVAREAGVRVEVRVKDTRARLVERFRNASYQYPGAAFALNAAEIADTLPETGDGETPATPDGSEADTPDAAQPDDGDTDETLADAA